jgi:peroxisomal 2,4-dienoyl-CoA reductase
VYLGANACIVGRNVEKTKHMAGEIAKVRPGSQVLGIGNVDVRNIATLEAAVEECIEKLKTIDFVM